MKIKRKPEFVIGRPYQVIELADGTITFIDNEDFHKVCDLNWFNCGGYAACGYKPLILMHHLVLGMTGWEKGFEVHHKDGDRLDNRKANLIKLTVSAHRTLHKRGQ